MKKLQHIFIVLAITKLFFSTCLAQLSEPDYIWSAYSHQSRVGTIAVSPFNDYVATVGRVPFAVSATRPPHQILLWDSFNPLPKLAIPLESILIPGPSIPLYKAALGISPDGEMLATQSGNYLAFFSPYTGDHLGSWKSDGVIFSIAFSPSGKYLATGEQAMGSNRINIWRTDGELLRRITVSGHTYKLLFTPDEQVLIAAGFSTLSAYNLAGNRLWSKSTSALNGTDIALLGDGDTLVTAEQRASRIRYISVSTGIEYPSLPTPWRVDFAIAVAPDGKYGAVAVNSTRRISLVDFVKRQFLSELPQEHRGFIDALAFSADGQTLYSGADDQILRSWKNSFKEFQLYGGLSNRTTTLHFTSDGTTIVSLDRTIRTFNAETGRMESFYNVFVNGMEANNVFSADIDSTGSKAAIHNVFDTTSWLTIKDLATGKTLVERSFGGSDIGSPVAYIPNTDPPKIAFGRTGQTLILNADTLEEISRINTQTPRRFAFSRKQPLIYVASSTQSVNAYSLVDGSLVWPVLSGESVWNLALTPDERYLLVLGAGNGRLSCWDCKSGDFVWSRPVQLSVGTPNLAVSPDSKKVISFLNGVFPQRVGILDVKTGDSIIEYSLPTGANAPKVAISPDGLSWTTHYEDGKLILAKMP